MPSRKLAYPQTRRTDQADTQFGVQVADPYRWLENDVRNDAEVKAWVDAQNAVTDAVPRDAAGPRRVQAADHRAVRLRAVRGAGEEGRPLFLHAQHRPAEPVGAVRPRRPGRRGPGADRSQRLVGRRRDRAGRMDAERGRQACSLYSVQDGGTDWRTVRVLDVATGKIPATRSSGSSSPTSTGRRTERLLLLALPGARGRAGRSSRLNDNQRSTSTGSARRRRPTGWSMRRPPSPSYSHCASVSDDGRWLVITTAEGTDERYEVHADRPAQPGREAARADHRPRERLELSSATRARASIFATNKDAPR